MLSKVYIIKSREVVTTPMSYSRIHIKSMSTPI
jgi:hypothetical protein